MHILYLFVSLLHQLPPIGPLSLGAFPSSTGRVELQAPAPSRTITYLILFATHTDPGSFSRHQSGPNLFYFPSSSVPGCGISNFLGEIFIWMPIDSFFLIRAMTPHCATGQAWRHVRSAGGRRNEEEASSRYCRRRNVSGEHALSFLHSARLAL